MIMMADYERGVNQASAVYKEVVREYVDQNDKLRELVRDMWCFLMHRMSRVEWFAFAGEFVDRMRKLEIDT